MCPLKRKRVHRSENLWFFQLIEKRHFEYHSSPYSYDKKACQEHPSILSMLLIAWRSNSHYLLPRLVVQIIAYTDTKCKGKFVKAQGCWF